MIKATIIADSISAYTNQRITTFELEYPRFILAELNTHRVFSRNTASSRAIPINKMIELVEKTPAIPIHFGLNQPGMQAKNETANIEVATMTWLSARDKAVESARDLQSLGLHKQIVNRVLEPFQTVKTLVTATSYDNFFALRCHTDAQPEIRHLANLMYQAMQESKPEVLKAGEWHTPYVHHERDVVGTNNYGITYYVLDDSGNVINLTEKEAIKVSCSCAAQVSYRKNDTSLEKALAIYDKLVNSSPVHASAFEHCATPIEYRLEDGLYPDVGITHYAYDGCVSYSGNFANWVQYRQLIPNHECKEYQP